MEISQVAEILEAEVLTCSDFLDGEVCTACGSDMMSDVLAFVKHQGILLTGLMNPQVIRTAMMMDTNCIVFVRGKMPSEEMQLFAENSGIVMMTTKYSMFESCGRLYEAGLGR
ncbi:MAG: hypothetical protein IK064_03975 [Clostridia bacterium]|nr:hypothetical protein [Clostridia bacterium]